MYLQDVVVGTSPFEYLCLRKYLCKKCRWQKRFFQNIILAKNIAFVEIWWYAINITLIYKRGEKNYGKSE